MNRWIVRSAAALLSVVGLCFSAGQVSAHVGYGNSLFSDASIIDPVTGVLGTGIVNSTPNRTVASNAGWIAGLDATTQANSHDNRFLYFNLADSTTINFTITGTANTNGASVLNPGYSIFSGIVPPSSHDGAIQNDAYLAAQTGFASWSSFAGANTAIVNAGGTITTDHWGQYRSNGDVTMSKDVLTGQTYPADQGAVSTMFYTGLFGANSTGNTVTGQYTLGPGLYSLVVGGANSTDLAALLSHAMATEGDYTTPSGALTGYNNARLARTFNIAFNVTPVPLPAAVWLFGSGVVGVIAFARRRKAQ
jgi:hypothetical protein